MFTKRQKLLIGGAVLFSVLLVAGSYFGRHWFFGPDVEPVPEHLLSDEPRFVSVNRPVRVSVSQDTSSVSETDLVSGDESFSDADSTTDSDEIDDAELEALVEALSALEQAEKFFPDGTPVPDHLLCPGKWVGVYLSSLSESDLDEILVHADRVAEEIVEKHNPQRPLAEIWPVFIDIEKQLRSESQEVLSDIRSIVTAGNRIDWLYDQAYRFPEIQALRLAEAPSGQWFNMYQVEMGYLDPDWNLIELPDGREFRVRDGYQYQIGMFEICLSDLATAELIVIDNLDETSDAELERLGGWNYNFNPYTSQPISQ